MIAEKPKTRVSRRKFLKGAAIVAPGVAATNVVGAWQQTATPVPRKWDKELDAVVIGSGFAGLSAVITAKDAGAKVVIPEKMPQKHEGGNSRVSGNMWWTPTNLPEALQ
jgi:heterodisulfide reductase subunit A-like polyferredoxin